MKLFSRTHFVAFSSGEVMLDILCCDINNKPLLVTIVARYTSEVMFLRQVDETKTLRVEREGKAGRTCREK